VNECKALPYGLINFFGNKKLFARTGQRHTLNVTRTVVDDNWGVSIPGPAIAINDAGTLNAESSSFSDNLGMIGFYLAGAGGVFRTSTRPTLNR